MAVVQSTYSERIDEAAAGLLASSKPHTVDSYFVENSNGIPFGRACGQGTADNQCRLGASAAATFLGVSVRDVTLDPELQDADYVDIYKQNTLAGLLSEGDIWVEVETAVSKGEDVTFNNLTGKLSSTGTGGTQFAIAGARWMTSAATGGLAVLRLSGELPSA